MDDIVERLRALWADPMWPNHAEVPKSLLLAAADEIERLRAEVARLKVSNELVAAGAVAADEEVAELRAERDAAVLAEREACAMTVERYYYVGSIYNIRTGLAAAIRARTQEKP
jgi:hypothetical protein